MIIFPQAYLVPCFWIVDDTMAGEAPPTWGGRPPEGGVVRSKEDLHNISQDSGLSISPVQLHEAPQLRIGDPIKHVGNLRPQTTTEHRKQKKNRWRVSDIFKRKDAVKSIEKGAVALKTEKNDNTEE